jgi:hypothetical protein
MKKQTSRVLVLSVLVFAVAIATPSHALTTASWGRITQLESHPDQTIIFTTFTHAEPVGSGSASCFYTDRFTILRSAAHHDSIERTLLAAFTSGSEVRLVLSGCGPGNAIPKIVSVYVRS